MEPFGSFRRFQLAGGWVLGPSELRACEQLSELVISDAATDASRRLKRRSLRQLAPIPDATPGAAGRFCTLSPARPSTFRAAAAAGRTCRRTPRKRDGRQIQKRAMFLELHLVTSRRASPTTRTRPRRPHHQPSPRTAAPRRTPATRPPSTAARSQARRHAPATSSL